MNKKRKERGKRKMKRAFLEQIKVLGELVRENDELKEQVGKLQKDLKKSVDNTNFWYNEEEIKR